MNKARLTYRFDRTGTRTDDLENEINNDPYRTRENDHSEHTEHDQRASVREKGGRYQEERAGRSVNNEESRYGHTERVYPEEDYRQQKLDAAEWERPVRDRLERAEDRSPKQHRYNYTEEEELYANFYKGNYDSLADKKRKDKSKVVSLFDDDFHVLPEDRQHTIFTNHNSSWDTLDDQETKRIERLIRDSGVERKSGEEPERPHKWGDEWNQRGAYPSSKPSFSRPESQTDARDIGYRGVTDDHYYRDNRDPDPLNSRTASGRSESSQRYGEIGADRGYYDEPTRFDGSSRYEENIDLYPTVKRNRRKNMPWIKVVASLALAVATGGLLGYYVLTLFSGDGATDTKSPNGSAIVQNGEQSELNPDNNGLITLPGADLTAAALEANISIPSKTFIMLQNGKFSTAQTAASAAEALDSGGFASATDAGDFYYVYAGIAADRDSVKALADKLRGGNFEIYAKEVTLPEVSHVNWNEGTDTLQSYIEETDKIVRMIAGLTLIHLEEESVTPLDAASLQALKKVHQGWSQQASVVNAGATENAKAKLQKMNNAINTAEQSLEAYSKKPASSLLWQAQTNLMQCILAEKELLAVITQS